MPAISSWDRKSGAYEHPKLHSAYKWFSRSKKIAKSLFPDVLGRRYCEKRMKTELSSLMQKAIFGKSSTLIWLVHPIYQLGYHPKVIVTYRKFGDYVVSRHLRFGWSLSELIKSYEEINETALLQLHAFGGCAVSYEELTNRNETGWAEALGYLTNLNYRDIVVGRDKRLSLKLRKHSVPLFDDITPGVYHKLAELKGKVISTGY
jgi:hypothetical protein